MTEKIPWDIARASGIIAWALISLSVIWGLLLSSRLLGRKAPPPWLLDVHRYLSGLAMVFTALHIGGLVGDNYLHIGWAEVLVPQASTWRPGAVTWGVIALYLYVAIEATSLAQRWLPRKLWRRVHILAFPLCWITSIHGSLAGTDAGSPWYRYPSIAVLAFITALTMMRVTIGRRTRKARPAATASAPAAPSPVPAGTASPHHGPAARHTSHAPTHPTSASALEEERLLPSDAPATGRLRIKS